MMIGKESFIVIKCCTSSILHVQSTCHVLESLLTDPHRDERPHLPSIPALSSSCLLLHSQGNPILQHNISMHCKDFSPISILSTNDCTVCYSLQTTVKYIKLQIKTGHYTPRNLLCSRPLHMLLSMELSLCLSSPLCLCFLTFTMKIYYPPNYQLCISKHYMSACLSVF